MTQTDVREVESLAGVFHPHAIEIQDFSYYALIVDVRPRKDFDEDHIPGAVSLVSVGSPAIESQSESTVGGLPQTGGTHLSLSRELEGLMARVKFDQAVLVYCGRGGMDSSVVARALRWRGWTADVLPGGWVNYRRWVQAGLESLPRLITFRIVMASLPSERRRLLNGLAQAREQVLDLAAIAACHGSKVSGNSPPQPSQMIFEGELLQALRDFDPHRPVWVADVDRQLGSIILPGGLMDALAKAPSAALACPFGERLASLLEDDPQLDGFASELAERDSTSSPLVSAGCARAEPTEAHDLRLLSRRLLEHDEQWFAHRNASATQHPVLPVLVTASLARDGLVEAILEWLPGTQS